MIRNVVLDTGPLVAFLDRSEENHGFAVEQFRQIRPPFYTCEPVIAEACYLLRHVPRAIDQIQRFLKAQLLSLPFSLTVDGEAVFELMRRYRNIPMSLADGCLVVMVEKIIGSRVFTLDSDFQIYRTAKGKPFRLVLS